MKRRLQVFFTCIKVGVVAVCDIKVSENRNIF
jgi:hypothetical protein